MSVNKIRGFICKNYYKQIGFAEENSYYSNETLEEKKDLLLLEIEKTPDPCNAKEHYQSFIRKKNRKLVKQSEIITHQPKTFENPNIADIESVITEHPKTSNKLSKAEKVGSNSSLNSDTKK